MGRIGLIWSLEVLGGLVQGCQSDRGFAIVSLSTLKLGKSTQAIEARGRKREEK